jgi:hypothetical protein
MTADDSVEKVENEADEEENADMKGIPLGPCRCSVIHARSPLVPSVSPRQTK